MRLQAHHAVRITAPPPPDRMHYSVEIASVIHHEGLSVFALRSGRVEASIVGELLVWSLENAVNAGVLRCLSTS